MKSSKKLLSFFLAVVMVFSVLTVMASAYTVADDVANGINYKYTVEKVATVPETAAGSAEYTADNIYAVTLWMKASLGVDVINTTLHYNKALFSPVMLYDGEVTYPHGAPDMDQDNYYTAMGEAAVYAYSFGDYMNNTGMYKDTGAVATTKALAKCIGLGNANATAIEATPQLISPDHPNYAKYSAGLPANTGIMSIWLSVAGNAKSAYFNTIEGINYSTDWNKMFTLYFETITDADVAGAEFGIFTSDAYTVDGNVDGSGYGYRTADYTAQVPEAFNISGNAVIEAEKIVYHVQNQYRPNGDNYDIGVKFGFKAEDIAIAFNEKGTSTNVSKVGADIYVNGEIVPDPDELFTSRFVYDINGDGSEFHYRVIIAGLAKADTTEYTIKPYVIVDGNRVDGEEVTVSAAAIVPQA